ncbi:MAG: hypothetical protein RIB60_10920 [Phycisphaerales bacterium]
MTGIPAIERLVAKYLVWRWTRVNPPSITVPILRSQQEELVGLVERAGGVESEAARARVRIKRLPGLESSSLEYSLAMVADHLARVNHAIAGTITTLKQGERSKTSADPAHFKPRLGVEPAAALADYDASIAAVQRAIEPPDHSNDVTHPHPWFGELSAETWMCFPAFHGQIHAKQARRIVVGLRRG